MVGPSRVRNGSVKPSQPSVNLGQTWSTLVKLGQPWEILVGLREMCPGPRFVVICHGRSPVGSGRLGSSCPVLRVDTRENPVGKNGVMTVAPSFFGVSWHKERRTKNK